MRLLLRGQFGWLDATRDSEIRQEMDEPKVKHESRSLRDDGFNLRDTWLCLDYFDAPKCI